MGTAEHLSEVSKQQKNKGDIKMISSYSITHLSWGCLRLSSYAVVIGSVALLTQLLLIVIECHYQCMCMDG